MHWCLFCYLTDRHKHPDSERWSTDMKVAAAREATALTGKQPEGIEAVMVINPELHSAPYRHLLKWQRQLETVFSYNIRFNIRFNSLTSSACSDSQYSRMGA